MFYAKMEEVTGNKFNVICWLSKTRIEEQCHLEAGKQLRCVERSLGLVKDSLLK